MKCLVSCVTYEPKFLPTTACQVCLIFLLTRDISPHISLHVPLDFHAQVLTVALPYFALAIFGLTTVGSLGGDNVAKAMVAVLIGLMINTIGLDHISGVTRFTFGTDALYDGMGSENCSKSRTA